MINEESDRGQRILKLCISILIVLYNYLNCRTMVVYHGNNFVCCQRQWKINGKYSNILVFCEVEEARKS